MREQTLRFEPSTQEVAGGDRFEAHPWHIKAGDRLYIYIYIEPRVVMESHFFFLFLFCGAVMTRQGAVML